MTVLAGLFCERALQKMVKGSFGKGSFGNKIHVSKYTCILLPKEPLPKEPFTIFCRARSQKRPLSHVFCYVMYFLYQKSSLPFFAGLVHKRELYHVFCYVMYRLLQSVAVCCSLLRCAADISFFKRNTCYVHLV